MISRSDQIRLHYEIAMSIGSSLDLYCMLKDCLTTILKKLNCPAGGVHFYQKESDGKYRFNEIISIPRNTSDILEYQKAFECFSSIFTKRKLDDFNTSLPRSGYAGDYNYYILKLPDLGVFTLIKTSSLDSLLIKSLEPLFNKIAVACNACMQNEELIRHKSSLQSLINEKTSELLIKNDQLKKEISQRKQSEEILAEKEKTLEEAQKIAHIGNWAWNIETNTLTWSDEIYRMFGIKPQVFNATYEAFLNFIHPEDRDNVEKAVNDAIHKNKPYNIMHRIILRNGIERMVQEQGKVTYNKSGKPVRMVGVVQDITERYQSEQRFKMAAEATTDLIYEWDIRDNTLLWFGDIDTALGFEKGEFPHTLKAWIDRIHPEDMSRLANAVEHHRISIDPISYEYKIQCKNGTWVDWSDYGMPVLDSSGKPYKWIGACNDITNKKKIERELAESEARYHAMLANEIYAICIFEIETKKFVDVNDAWLKLYGYDKNEIKNLTIIDVTAEPESTQKAVKNSTGMRSVFIPERVHKKKDGTVFFVEISAGAFTWKGKKLMYALIHDIGERKKVEDDLQKAKAIAEKANKSKSIFLANMSHELRSPLNAIIGFSELMKRDNDITPGQIETLEIINRSGEYLLTLINDILEISKIEAGRIGLNQKNFDLYQLLNNLEEMFRFKIQKKKLLLNFIWSKNVPQYICTDQSKLRQVLINLLDNAIKYTREGQIKLHITKSNCKKKNKANHCNLCFEVSDTGIGIAKEDMDKIFDAFYQSDKHNMYHQGTGLGLPISKKFADIMGGELNVVSEIGKGSCFSLEICAQIVDGTGLILTESEYYVTGLADNQPDYRLMVVEDNEINRNLLVCLLRSVGFIVKEAVNGQEAVKMWQSWNPHLIWMDMRMPVMDGYEATKIIKSKIKELGISPVSKIIAITASAFEEDRLKVIEHGCDDFVRKPFHENDIFRMLEKHLNIKYTFEDKLNKKIKTDSVQNLITGNLRSELSVLPIKIKTKLLEAVELSEVDEIHKIIDRIGNENPSLGNALSKLADNFAYNELIKLLKDVSLE